jgi:hypothetical protein
VTSTSRVSIIRRMNFVAKLYPQWKESSETEELPSGNTSFCKYLFL